MTDVLLAWELGSGLGHVNRLRALGDALAAEGLRVVYALVRRMPEPHLHAAPAREEIQAPFLKKPERAEPYPICSYGELLMRCGYGRREHLGTLFEGWRARFEHYAPRLVVADHAPTALLAARALGIPAVRFGTGFAAPPQHTPFPLLSPAFEPYRERTVANEQVVLETVNATLAAAGHAPLAGVQDMFDAISHDFITSFAELDHYANRGAGTYCGPVYSAATGPEPRWDSDRQPRIFAYLKPEYQHFRAALAQLADTGVNLLVHAGEPDAATCAHYASRGVAFAPRPVDLPRAAALADLVVCHAGHATVLQSLMAGTPLVLLPLYREQQMTAARVAALGAGVIADPMHPSTQAGACVRALLDGDAARVAGAFAGRYRSHDRQAALARITAACRDLVGSGN